jgi:hypothetical protein
VAVEPSSQAARDLSALAQEARRRNTAAVKRIIAAYRRLHPGATRGRPDGEVLGRIADDFEQRAADAHATAS